MSNNDYKKYKLTFPVEGQNIYYSRSFEKAVSKCYRELKLYNKKYKIFIVTNLDDKEDFIFKKKTNKLQIGGNGSEYLSEEYNKKINELSKKLDETNKELLELQRIKEKEDRLEELEKKELEIELEKELKKEIELEKEIEEKEKEIIIREPELELPSEDKEIIITTFKNREDAFKDAHDKLLTYEQIRNFEKNTEIESKALSCTIL